MKRYVIPVADLEKTFDLTICTIVVCLDDAEAHEREAVREAVEKARAEVVDYAAALLNSHSRRDLADNIRLYVFSDPAPAQTATLTTPKIAFCEACGTALGIEGDTPAVKVEAIEQLRFDDFKPANHNERMTILMWNKINEIAAAVNDMRRAK